MDSTKFTAHTYSHLPQFQSSNELKEDRVIDSVVNLYKAWGNRESDEELMDIVKRELDDQGVYVLVEENETNKMVGFGALSKGVGYGDHGKNVGFLDLAFVLPDYRKQGLYTNMIQAREEAASRIGYDTLVVEPFEKARKILEKTGYAPFYGPDGEIGLIKTLVSHDKETQSPGIETNNLGFKS